MAKREPWGRFRDYKISRVADAGAGGGDRDRCLDVAYTDFGLEL